MISFLVLNPFALSLATFSLDVFDRKTDVVHPNFVEVANVRIGQWLRIPVSQELDFRSWRRVLQNECDVIGLHARNAHVTGKWLPSNHNGNGFFEPQESKKHLGAVNIPHDDRAVVEMFYHAVHPCVSTVMRAKGMPTISSSQLRTDFQRSRRQILPAQDSCRPIICA